MSKDPDAVDPTDDDLEAWGDDDLVRALRAPGSTQELSEQDRFLAAFRADGPPARAIPLRRRLAGRLGAGGAVITVVALSGGGVAAALTGNLPDPVQEFAHSVLGAPAPQPSQPAEESPTATASHSDPVPSTSPATPSAEPTRPTRSRSSDPGRSGSPSRAAVPSPATGSPEPDEPSATPSASPSDQPPPAAAPAAISISAGSHLVPPGQALSFAGQVTSETGEPVGGVTVALLVNEGSGWRRVTRVTSDPAGGLSASGDPVTGLVRYRWRVKQGALSEPWRVRVQPTIAASYSADATDTAITATCVGADAGDVVQLFTMVARRPTLVATAVVDRDGTARFTVATPRRERTFSVRLKLTEDHAAARTKLTVRPPT